MRGKHVTIIKEILSREQIAKEADVKIQVTRKILENPFREQLKRDKPIIHRIVSIGKENYLTAYQIANTIMTSIRKLCQEKHYEVKQMKEYDKFEIKENEQTRTVEIMKLLIVITRKQEQQPTPSPTPLP